MARHSMKGTFIGLMTVVLTACAVAAPMASAATASRNAATCVIHGPGGGPCPKLGSYYPSPRTVQLPKGPGYTTTFVYDDVTDYSPQPPGTVPTAFLVEARITAQRKITITCKLGSHQIVPSDTHMNLYLNGTDTGYVPAYKSTCGDHPNFRVTLKRGQSTNIFAEFHFTPHPGNVISISQFSYSTILFRPYGSRVRLPDRSGRGAHRLARVKQDLSYVKSFLANIVRDIGLTINSFGLTPDQWEALVELPGEVLACNSGLDVGFIGPECADAFSNFLLFNAAPVS